MQLAYESAGTAGGLARYDASHDPVRQTARLDPGLGTAFCIGWRLAWMGCIPNCRRVTMLQCFSLHGINLVTLSNDVAILRIPRKGAEAMRRRNKGC